MSLYYWKFKELDLPFDNQDAEFMKRYEEAFDRMGEEAQQIPTGGRASGKIEAYCQVFRNLFDRLFGEGTAAKIFENEPVNIGRCNEIYEEFLDFVQECNAESARRQAEFIAKYTPKKKKP